MAVERFCKLDDAGNELPVDATTWSQVLDRDTQLIWLADPLDRAPWKEAVANAAKCTAGGHAWRAPTIREQLSLVDYERFDPAIDTTFFRGESAWFWTSTPDASSPGGCAWGVSFYYGYAYYYGQGLRGFVRPVARCYIVNGRSYARYGGMTPPNDRKPEFLAERNDNDGNYEPANCRLGHASRAEPKHLTYSPPDVPR